MHTTEHYNYFVCSTPAMWHVTNIRFSYIPALQARSAIGNKHNNTAYVFLQNQLITEMYVSTHTIRNKKKHSGKYGTSLVQKSPSPIAYRFHDANKLSWADAEHAPNNIKPEFRNTNLTYWHGPTTAQNRRRISGRLDFRADQLKT